MKTSNRIAIILGVLLIVYSLSFTLITVSDGLGINGFIYAIIAIFITVSIYYTYKLID
jgi:hypothetical protein